MDNLVDKLFISLKNKGWMCVTAESCTGGMIAALLTERAGASATFERGYVTYSNAAKTSCLGVSEALLTTHGAVSEPVARAMAQGALRNSQAHLSISVTGIAGPDGGTPEKPVGTVFIGISDQLGQGQVFAHIFKGSRAEIRAQTVHNALTHAIAYVEAL